MNHPREWKIFGSMAVIFGLAYYLPLANPRVVDAILEAFKLLQWYVRNHTLACVVPALFIAGDRDGVITGSRAAVDALPQTVPKLQASILLEGCGHWTQQERPEEVNRAILEFLETL